MDDELASAMDTVKTLLKRLDPVATALAIAGFLVMVIALELHWAVSILLAEGIYAGIWLIRDAGRPVEPPTPPAPVLPEDFAYVTKSRTAATTIASFERLVAGMGGPGIVRQQKSGVSKGPETPSTMVRY